MVAIVSLESGLTGNSEMGVGAVFIQNVSIRDQQEWL